MAAALAERDLRRGHRVDADGNPIDASGPSSPSSWASLDRRQERLHSFGVVGSRTMIHPATIRFYLCVPSGQGTDDAYTQADVLGALFELKGLANTGSSITRTWAPSINATRRCRIRGRHLYWVLMIEIPAEFTYLA
jgi:hypothetical protein